MAHRIVWSPRALADLEAIATFISRDSPAYARTVVRKIIGLTRNLAEFPLSGRKMPELDDDQVRELIAYSYRIIYRVEDREVIVAAVVHGKRMLDQ
jgi:toxin ParE1/3/4